MDWGHEHLILHIHLSPHHPGGGGLSGRPTERGGSYMCTPAEGKEGTKEQRRLSERTQ